MQPSSIVFDSGDVDSANEETAGALCESLSRSSCLALVGAGSSKLVGYPLWQEFLARMAAEILGRDPGQRAVIEGLDKEQDLVWRATELRRLLGDHYGPFMRELFGPERPPFTPFHQDFVRLPFRHVLTTNYDAVLESAHETALGRHAHWLEWSHRSDIEELLCSFEHAQDERRYVHLHGRFHDPDSLVLTHYDYDERYQASSETFEKLFALLATHPLLSVGFSLTDPDVMDIFRRMHVATGYDEKQHFAILPAQDADEATRQRRRLYERYGIRGLFFVTDGKDYSGMHEWIREISRRLGRAGETQAEQGTDPESSMYRAPA